MNIELTANFYDANRVPLLTPTSRIVLYEIETLNFDGSTDVITGSFAVPQGVVSYVESVALPSGVQEAVGRLLGTGFETFVCV